MKRTYRLFLLTIATLVTATVTVRADNSDYKETAQYKELRDSMHHAFNDGDSARFFLAVKNLQDFLLQQNDLHAYYTQRCNEIVFQLNQQHIFEAYKLATQLSKELTERKLDKEMYMAINMMGHIYRYSGNKESAKRCFWEVIDRMEKEGYTESQPPIYMNLVNILMDEDPDEAMRLMDKAVQIAGKTSPERVFDIEARRTLAYYRQGDTQRFLDGYKAYREGVEKGLSSVHGRTLEVYYLAYQGRVDEAIQLAKKELSGDYFSTVADIYSSAGRWEDAYKALKDDMAETDSVNSVILSSSMQGIQDELHLYETERQSARQQFYALAAITLLLLLLVLALVYIVQSRRRHLREMKKAYEHALESDKMKTTFIQNVSHEVRTPLNIISGFAQVIADPDYDVSPEERQHIANTMRHNTHLITTMIDEVLEMSVNDSPVPNGQDATPMPCNAMLQRILNNFSNDVGSANIDFKTALDNNFIVNVYEGQLRRILTPLLDNAVKNAPNGHILLNAETTAKELVLTVEDNGCGIPAKEAEHIFERFVKLDSFKEGLGLGLSYSRSMARRLKGDVVLDTTFPGPGARFKVTIPL